MTTIPQTADAFKEWADRECGEWPMELTSYHTWQAMTSAVDPVRARQEFTERYRQWEASQS